MVHNSIGKHLGVHGGMFILLALMLLLLPVKWLLAALLAAAIHEFCHWVMICVCHGKMVHLQIGLVGAVMQVEELTPGKEFLCSLAGPLGGLCLLFFTRWIPRTAVCALVQSCYNLLPLLPMDGGRILNCCLQLFLSDESAVRICDIVARCTKIFVCSIAAWLSLVWQAGILPLAFAAMILLRTNFRKTLAN